MHEVIFPSACRTYGRLEHSQNLLFDTMKNQPGYSSTTAVYEDKVLRIWWQSEQYDTRHGTCTIQTEGLHFQGHARSILRQTNLPRVVPVTALSIAEVDHVTFVLDRGKALQRKQYHARHKAKYLASKDLGVVISSWSLQRVPFNSI